MNCQSCGTEIPENQTICPNCQTPVEEEKKKPSIVRKIIGWVLGTLGLASIIGNVIRVIPDFWSILEFAPALLLASVLMLVGGKLADPEGENGLMSLFKGIGGLVAFLSGFAWLTILAMNFL